MRKSKFSESQIAGVLQEAEADVAVEEVARKHGISAATFYQWRSKYGGMSVSDMQRLRELEQENARLKRMLCGSEPRSRRLEGAAHKKVLTPMQRREAVAWAMNDKQLSQRRACRLMTQPRGTQRRTLRGRKDDALVESRLVELANEHGAWGCPQLHQQLRREGHRINHKRTQRLYRKHGLSLRRRRRRRLPERVQQPLLQQLHPNQVWSMDFMSDTLVNRRAYRTFNVIDDCARDVLAIEIDFSLTGERIVRVLQQLCEWHGKPDVMRSDHGPELTSFAVEKRFVAMSCRHGPKPAVLNGSSPNPGAQHKTRTSNDSTARTVSKYLMPINSKALIKRAP